MAKASGRTVLKFITINSMGIALFVVLSLCLRVPVFENYYLCLGYVAMAVYCYSIGTISGTIVGTLGTVLYCFLINGLRGMPGWALGNIIIGIIMGSAFRLAKKINITWVKLGIMSLAVVIGVTLGILVVKSYIEVLLYSQPFMVRTASNIYAFVADIVVQIGRAHV